MGVISSEPCLLFHHTQIWAELKGPFSEQCLHLVDRYYEALDSGKTGKAAERLRKELKCASCNHLPLSCGVATASPRAHN